MKLDSRKNSQSKMTKSSDPEAFVLSCKACKKSMGISSVVKRWDIPTMTKILEFLVVADEKSLKFEELDTDVSFPNEEGKDQFCCFRKIKCHNCREVIGRRYLSSTGKIDEVIDRIILELSKIHKSSPQQSDTNEGKSKGLDEEIVQTSFTPIKKACSLKKVIEEEPSQESVSHPDLNETISVASKQDDLDEEISDLEKLKIEQRSQIRTLRNSLIDFADVVTEIDDRIKRSEQDIIVLNAALRKIDTLISKKSNA
jgi:hypothetical protein